MTAVIETAPAPAPTLTSSLLRLLNYYGMCVGHLGAELRTPSGVGQLAPQLRVDGAFVTLPDILLTALEERRWCLALDTVVKADTGGLVRPLLAVSWDLEPVLTANGWAENLSRMSTVAASLLNFACPPTCVVDAFCRCVAVWALTAPVPAESATALLAGLAQRLEAEPAPRLPVPGALAKDAGDPAPLVIFASPPTAARISLSQLAAALAPTRRTKA